MEARVGDIVLPGQVAKDQCLEDASNKNKVILGPGLKRLANDIFVCRAGILRKKGTNTLYVDGLQNKYVPAPDETVVGVVTKKIGDYFRVDIGASEQAILHYLALEGTSKKLRPNLNVGDLIFGRVLLACPDMEPELVCVNGEGKKEKLGIISSDGYVFVCSLHLIRKITSPQCKLIPLLGSKLKFEIAIGMNGKIWIKGSDVQTTIAVGGAILSAEVMTNQEIEKHCQKLLLFH